jgi:sigma-E factor negative regulatory protein RseC
MLIQQAVIAKIDEQGVWVSAMRQSACGNCQQQRSCQQSSDWLKNSAQSSLILVSVSQLAVNIGDTVEIAMPEQQLWQGLIYLYVLPLLALTFGAMIGQCYAQEIGAVFFSVCAFVGSLVSIHYTQQRQHDNCLPIISKKIT